MMSATTSSRNAAYARRTGWEGAELFAVKGNAEGAFLILTEKGSARKYPTGSARRHRMIQEGIAACAALVDQRSEELAPAELDRYMDMYAKFSDMLTRNLRAQIKERAADAAQHGTEVAGRSVVQTW